ncbi:MAG: sulfatase-like hydrolase/transferase [Pirellulaceae bacterium]
MTFFRLGNLFCWLTLLVALLFFGASGVSARPPNFVLIVADDLGYGDLGCYGSETVKSPHLDRLAAEGLRLTDFHSNGPMCSPTRAALLTGLYQQRFGRRFERALGKGAGGGGGLTLEAVTLAEELKRAGYATGMFGKWHLGYEPPYLPTRQGFDEFRGLVSGDGDHHTHIDRSGGEDWWNGERIEMQSGYTADLLTQHAVDFIERKKDQPFFLYVPHLAIHFPWQGPDDPPHRREGVNYANDKWGQIPDRRNVRPHVEAMIAALDRSVGEIVSALEQHQLAEDTLVFFTSDNGGYLTYGQDFRNISSNGPLRGQKGDVFEGGHRVPAIARWPGRIEAGTTSAAAITMDLMPTFLELAGRTPRHKLDGVSLTGLLLENKPLEERTLFWRMGIRAARRGDWKIVWPAKGGPMLFNLSSDLGELNDVAPAHPRIAGDLQEAILAWEKEVEPQ